MNADAKRTLLAGLDALQRELDAARALLGEPARPAEPDRSGGTAAWYERPVLGKIVDSDGGTQDAEAVGEVGPFLLVTIAGATATAIRRERFRRTEGQAEPKLAGVEPPARFADADGTPISVKSFVVADCPMCKTFPCSCKKEAQRG